MTADPRRPSPRRRGGLHRALQALPALAPLRRLQRRLGCYAPADLLADLRSNLVKVVTPEHFLARLLGIDDVPPASAPLPAGGVAHIAWRLSEIEALIERMDIREDDVFWDIGSGMGGIPMLVSWFTGARTHGVELQGACCDRATAAARAFGLPRVTFHHADARDVDYRGGTRFFLFTPFTGPVLDSVMDRLRDVALDHPVVVGWAGPRSHLEGQRWLHEVDPVEGGDPFALRIYRSRPPG